MGKRENPGFMFYADDALAWEPIAWIGDALLGQAFRLIVYGCKNGGSLPVDHPLLAMLDPKVVALCTRAAGDRVEIIAPHDLPRLMANRAAWRESRRKGATAAGRDASGRFGGRPHMRTDETARADEKAGVPRTAYRVQTDNSPHASELARPPIFKAIQNRGSALSLRLQDNGEFRLDCPACCSDGALTVGLGSREQAGNAVLKCHRTAGDGDGCAVPEIVAALGCRMADLRAPA